MKNDKQLKYAIKTLSAFPQEKVSATSKKEQKNAHLHHETEKKKKAVLHITAAAVPAYVATAAVAIVRTDAAAYVAAAKTDAAALETPHVVHHHRVAVLHHRVEECQEEADVN